MDVLNLLYDMKYGSAGPPKIYLGDDIKKYQVNSGKSHWSMSNIQQTNNAIKTVEGLPKDEDRQSRKAKSAGNQMFLNKY